MAAKPTSSSPHVSVNLSLEVTGGRPEGAAPDQYVASILCAVMNGVMDQTVRFLDKNPDLIGARDQNALRRHIMDGAVVASVEQLCAAWRFSRQPDDLPQFVKTMFKLFEQSLSDAGYDEDCSPFKPTVGDVGHA